MENASKALIIAAAILISIMIISLGIWVFSMANNAVSNVDMSDTEIASFNSKFTAYEGTNVTGSKVNAMLTTVLQHNLNQSDEGMKVEVKAGSNTNVKLGTSDNQIASTVKADTGKSYTVECHYSTTTARIDYITVTLNS